MANSVSDILRVAAVQRYGGVDQFVNVFHFRIIALPTPNDNTSLLEDIGEKLSTAWGEIAANIPTGLEPDVIQVFNITQDAPVGIGSWDPGYTGGASIADAMPTDDAALVLWGTDVKRRQGRTYLGPFSETVHADSRWSGTLTSNIGTWAAALRDENPQGNGSELRLGVYSKSGGAHSIITSVRIQTLVAQQERRKLGRGS
jgi:hypothetical protein